MIDAAHWQHRLDELRRQHRVPGATLGILRAGTDDEPMVAGSGIINTATGVEVTADTLFQIGSITKVWTATLVMQLVDEGLLDLDAPISEVLPELDAGIAKQVTMRHLLAHTSGIDGDIFLDTGRGDDCIRLYVEQLGAAAQNHPLGVTFSYCNAGFVLAGRVVEKLTGMTWDAALRVRISDPLGLTRTVTLPEDALLWRTAVGHVAEGDGDPRPASQWMLPRSGGPAGLICASAADVLTFTRMHLAGGAGPDGTRVLSEASTAAMTEKQTDLPDRHTLGDSWGLGWIRFDWDGAELIGHDGNTMGQSSFLRVLPEQGLAVVLLTNGGHPKDLYQDLFREIFAELAGVRMPPALAPAPHPAPPGASRHAGVYERAGMRIEIFQGAAGLRMRQTVTGTLAALVPEPVQEHDLLPVEDDVYVMRPPGTQTWVPVTFYALPTGEPYLHHALRATPKVFKSKD